MKRSEISHLYNKKVVCEGKFIRYQVYPHRLNGFSYNTMMLLKNVRINGIVIDHLWISCSRRARNLNLRQGATIQFNGIVSRYHSGYNVIEKRSFKVLKNGSGISLLEFLNQQEPRYISVDLLQYLELYKGKKEHAIAI